MFPGETLRGSGRAVAGLRQLPRQPAAADAGRLPHPHGSAIEAMGLEISGLWLNIQRVGLQEILQENSLSRVFWDHFL